MRAHATLALMTLDEAAQEQVVADLESLLGVVDRMAATSREL